MTAPNTDGDTGSTDGGAPATGDAQLGDAGKAALAAERKAKRDAEKALTDALARLKDYEDRDKSDADKLTERASSAETRADTAERELLRLRVAVETKLPANLAERLQGTTEDELRADAAELLKLVAPSTPEPPAPLPGAKPRERMRGGGDPTGGAMPLNGDPIVNALNRKLGIAG